MPKMIIEELAGTPKTVKKYTLEELRNHAKVISAIMVKAIDILKKLRKARTGAHKADIIEKVSTFYNQADTLLPKGVSLLLKEARECPII